MRLPRELTDLIGRQTERPAPPAVDALAEEILARHASCAQAILFYGSCFREGDDAGGVVDLYLLVDTYRAAYGPGMRAFLNKVLPPNVFYLEVPFEKRVVRAKYAVLSLNDFLRGTSSRWFHSYLWGRFAQPAGVLNTRSAQAADQVRTALAQAAVTFITRVLPRMDSPFSARELWTVGLSLGYRAELRAERPEGVVRLVDAAAEYYEELTRSIMAAVPFPVEIVEDDGKILYNAHVPARVRHLSRFTWRIRFLQGKALSVLRLLKGLITFRGGLDYILWKIERHSGVTVEVTPRMRRHPLLAAWFLSWRIYRRGGFR